MMCVYHLLNNTYLLTYLLILRSNHNRLFLTIQYNIRLLGLERTQANNMTERKLFPFLNFIKKSLTHYSIILLLTEIQTR